MHFSKSMKWRNEDGTHTVQDDCQDDLQCARQRTDNVCSLTPHSCMWSWWWTNSIKALDCYVPPHCLGAWCVCHDYEPSPSLYIQFIIFSQTPPLLLLLCTCCFARLFFPSFPPIFLTRLFFVSSSSFISHLIDCCRLHFFFFSFFQLFCLERGIILIFWIPPTYCFLICVCVGNVISSVSSALSLKSIGCCRAATGIRQRDTPVVAFPDSYHQSQIRVVVYTSYIYSLTKSIYSAHK